jgi:hypothetical protein
MENLEQKFKENLEEWRKHCLRKINSSNPHDYINCEAYRNIAAIGHPALPLIRKAYETESKSFNDPDSLNWELHNLVVEIIGEDFKIPDWMKGRIKVIEKYTIKWLDENMDKYMRER